MSKTKGITGSRVELFILKSWEPDDSHDYEKDWEEGDPEGLPEDVEVPVRCIPVLEMHLADSLRSGCCCNLGVVPYLPNDGEQRFFKVWFDLSTRKVLDVRSVKPETFDLVSDTYELEDPADRDAIAKVQACFDIRENKGAFDGLEILVRDGIAELRLGSGSPPLLPSQHIYFTLSVPEDLDFFILPEVRESWKDWQDPRAKTATS
jgi:hypothetical protein